MESEKSLAYLRAKRKVEYLVSFYSHILVYVVINTLIILVSANVFNSEEVNFSKWSNYITAAFWGIGLLCHALYVLYIMKFENNFLRKWEEKKIKEFLDEDQA